MPHGQRAVKPGSSEDSCCRRTGHGHLQNWQFLRKRRSSTTRIISTVQAILARWNRFPWHPRDHPHDSDSDHRRWRPTRPHRRKPPPIPPPAPKPPTYCLIERLPATSSALAINVTDTALSCGLSRSAWNDELSKVHRSRPVRHILFRLRVICTSVKRQV